jgi:dethiobiotin synthetase
LISRAIIHALRAEGRKVGAIKPLATGASLEAGRLVSEDARILHDALESDVPMHHVGPFVYEEPLAPSVAARRAGSPLRLAEVRTRVQSELEWWAERAEVVVVEGVGGLLCPISEDATVADLAEFLDFPLVIVGRRGLGTLNHCLLTVEAARRRGLRIAALVLNGSEPTSNAMAEETNARELSRHLREVAILPEVRFGDDVHAWAIANSVGSWYDKTSPRRWTC